MNSTIEERQEVADATFQALYPYFAISTVNDSPAGRTGYRIFGKGQTIDAANEDATDHIGGRDIAKTMTEQTLYRNLIIVTANQLSKYGLA